MTARTTPDLIASSDPQEDAPMGISWLDHVNIRTANLAAMSRFYEDILGMPRGSRPEFRFGGACRRRAPPRAFRLPLLRLRTVPRPPATGQHFLRDRGGAWPQHPAGQHLRSRRQP